MACYSTLLRGSLTNAELAVARLRRQPCQPAPAPASQSDSTQLESLVGTEAEVPAERVYSDIAADPSSAPTKKPSLRRRVATFATKTRQSVKRDLNALQQVRAGRVISTIVRKLTFDIIVDFEQKTTVRIATSRPTKVSPETNFEPTLESEPSLTIFWCLAFKGSSHTPGRLTLRSRSRPAGPDDSSRNPGELTFTPLVNLRIGSDEPNSSVAGLASGRLDVSLADVVAVTKSSRSRTSSAGRDGSGENDLDGVGVAGSRLRKETGWKLEMVKLIASSALAARAGPSRVHAMDEEMRGGKGESEGVDGRDGGHGWRGAGRGIAIEWVQSSLSATSSGSDENQAEASSTKIRSEVFWIAGDRDQVFELVVQGLVGEVTVCA